MKSLNLILIFFLMLAVSCEDIPYANKKNEPQNIDFFNMPSGGYWGYFYCATGYGRISNAQYEDTLISSTEVINEPSGKSAAYFGRNVGIDYCRINNRNYIEWNYSNNIHYDIYQPTLYYNGMGNVFEWSIDNQVFRDTLYYNAPFIEFITPIYMQTYSKNQDLVISWQPSNFENDVVQITITGQPPIPAVPRDSASIDVTYLSFLCEDNGEFIISANTMTTFKNYENKAQITISRGTYKESWHGGNKYLFVIYCTHGIDIRLQ